MLKTKANERIDEQNDACACDEPDTAVGRHRDRTKERSFERSVALDPTTEASWTVAAGGVVPLGLAGAAVAATCLSPHEKVAVTAWIAVAIVGTASVISAATVSRRKSVSVDRNNFASNEMHKNLADRTPSE